MKKSIKKILTGIIAAFTIIITSFTPAYAGQFSVSPMYQFISLIPGETYVGNFEIVNPGENQYDLSYTIDVEPFSVDETDDISLTANGDYNRIVDWIELTTTEGRISPNTHQEIRFTIKVPENAPAGGQYASIVVSSGEFRVDNDSVDLREVYRIPHLLYAEVAGETVRKGDIIDAKVPSFLFSGQIKGSATFKNDGNVHSKAIQTLQIFPLLSKEEIYTNEENPKEILVMPENRLASSVAWEQTPKIGIFHVIYNASYEGVDNKVDKYVIICPIWLLIVIFALIFLIIFKIIFSGKGEKEK